MNVLVIGGAWTDTSSFGNTLSNFFEDWEETQFSNIYFRGTAPQNNICENYFSITDYDILRNFFVSSKIGKRMYISQTVEASHVAQNEKKMISLIHKFKFNLAYEIEDLLWETDVWKNKKLDDFIDEANPDIIFTFASGSANIVRMIDYIKYKTNAKTVTFVADDVMASALRKKGRRKERLIRNLKHLFDISSWIYGISEELCQIYEDYTGKNIAILKKGCTEFMPLKTEFKLPLKMVYAGNLLYGRESTLEKLVSELKKINEKESCFFLEIYTGTEIETDIRQKLEVDGTSRFAGEVPYQVVKEKMTEADIVIHLESFLEDNIELVKNSFSTKIIDCLQSGNILLAIGPKELASIKYISRINGTYVIDEVENINSKLCDILNAQHVLDQRAKDIRAFALQNHSANANREKLRNDFIKLM